MGRHVREHAGMTSELEGRPGYVYVAWRIRDRNTWGLELFKCLIRNYVISETKKQFAEVICVG